MKNPKRSPVALAVLAMLYEAPMHPYRMQRLIKDRGKDMVINVTQRASLYQTIRRLEREGLIATRQTIHDAGRPERTVYEIADLGRDTLIAWMCQILSTPAAEYPEFPAAVSFMALLSPEQALQLFERRSTALRAAIAALDEELSNAIKKVPRLFLLETEYVRAIQAAELAWVTSVIDDLRAGRLTWSEAWLREIAEKFDPDLTGGAE